MAVWDRHDEDFDAETARGMCGKTVIVGMTHVDTEGRVLELEQFFGVIERFNRDDVLVRLEDGEALHLPPVTGAFRAAVPGAYRFRSSGRAVLHPHVVTCWTVRRPDEADEPA